MAQNWKNRIIRQETVPISDILPNAKNWRKHPVKQQTHVKGSLDNLGWIRSVLVNLRTSKEWEITERNKKTVIDGHLRLDLALKNGEDKIPVEYVDLSPDEERIALASIDPLAAMAETDEEMLDSLLASIDCDVPEINDMLADVGDLNGLDTEGEAQEDEYEPPAEIQTDIKRGDIILLGRHRLMCGDSTSKEDVGRLMDGKKADACVTDPPYGTASESKVQLRGHNTLKEFNINWDAEYPKQWIPAAKQAIRSGAGVICFGDNKRITSIWEYLEKEGYHPLQTIYWIKPTVPQPRMNFCSNVESAIYSRLPDGKPTWNGGGATPNYFESPRSSGGERTCHETQKPIKLFSYLIPLISNENNIILDPFLGSGTTLIACEQLGRICYGMEISPQYCEVICQRWEKFTGKIRECLKE